MDRTKWPSVIGLVIGTILLSNEIPTTFAFDKPTLSSVLLLASSAVSVIGFSRLLPRAGGRSIKGHQYDAVPLDDVGHPHPSREPSPGPEDVAYPSSLRKLRIHFIVLVCAIGLRVEMLRHIVANIQCTVLSWEPMVPLVFACWDYWTIQRHKRRPVYDDPNGSVYDALEHFVVRAPYRYVMAVALVSLGSVMAATTTRSPPSTYICAASLPYHWVTPLLQRLGTGLEIVIIYCFSQLLHQKEGRGPRSAALRFISVGWALVFSAIILLALGLMYCFALATVEGRRRILEIPACYGWSVLKLDAILSLTVLCACLAILHVGVTTVTLLSAFTSVCTLTTAYAWSNTLAFPPMHSGLGFLAISIAILGFALYFHIESISEDKTQEPSLTLFTKIPSWFYLCLLAVFFVRAGLWASSGNTVNYHPIDMLIYDAQMDHERFLNQSSASKTLAEAVDHYKQRYNRHPPPNFQHWYNYATARNSVIIDDFDSIDRDLLPFNAMRPEEIRERTWKLMSNPWHDASGLSIRAGKVEISPNVMPTHRWMLDGLVEMIGRFAEWLPDMDLAFNVNDECRVAVEYEDLQQLRNLALDQDRLSNPTPRNSFSGNRAEQWITVAEEPNQERVMTEKSWQQTFYSFGSVGCPSGSAARDRRIWEVGQLCTSCIKKQSMGNVLANWTVAGDVCHQPDLAQLHGIYTSPAAFKGTHNLYPIFSQSKVPGFNDILYPSAWNYMDKAKYAPNEEYPDPPFADKNNSIFWRGATSEGFSSGNGKAQWKGMTRQRFVHLANDVNGTGPAQSILMPYDVFKFEKRLRYVPLPISDLTKFISTDVHVVNSIVRCGGVDCPHQAAELAPLVPPSEFQSHWQYKYLLDLDGAGFSGRFLPFLSSRSLPFKAAVFREWWDDRVMAWQHFVPLDVRGHGFWATLVYFAGMKGTARGREISLEGHQKQGERIAENGRRWAEQVLRKEDMEIYFFRLLLEWGRLTDDARDSIGYAIEAG